jgi:hypothetical protein
LRATTAIGTAISLHALVAPTSIALDELLLGDEVVAVGDPLDPTGALKAPESGAEELAIALETLAARPGPRLPLTLFEAGYPSSAELGSSEQAQRSYYEALFGLLDTRRDEVSFVGVYGLGDRAAVDCEAEALSFGDSGDGGEQQLRALARCSMGLRAEPPEPPQTKLAWPEVSAALSRYR